MTDPCQRSAQPAPPLTESHASIVGGFTAFPNTRLDTVFAGWPVVVSVAPRPAAACGISLWEYGISMCRSPPVRPLRRCSLRRPSYTASRHCRRHQLRCAGARQRPAASTAGAADGFRRNSAIHHGARDIDPVAHRFFLVVDGREMKHAGPARCRERELNPAAIIVGSEPGETD